jgi:NAD(P)H-hydrate epimerase
MIKTYDSTQPLYSAAQIRKIECIAIDEFGIPAYELMITAGQAVFDFIDNNYPNARRITVVCGSGNNAGDGYVVARLGLLAGKQVDVISLIEPTKLQGAARQAFQEYKEVNGSVTLYTNDISVNTDVIVDALLGTGLDRNVSGNFADAIEAINRAEAVRIAVDIPSGLHADTGSLLGCAVKADATVTFIGLKQGLFTCVAGDYCGEILSDSLQIPLELYEAIAPEVRFIGRKRLNRRPRAIHKGHCGHILLAGGNHGYSGAIRLAGEAAARVGAGLVSIATRSAHADLININRPELMCHGIDNAEQLQALSDKADIIGIGPGLGQDDWAHMLLNAILNTNKPIVIDADALNLIARSPCRRENWVLTPHPGEAARLLSVTTQVVQADRFSAAKALQDKYGGRIILKGYGSLVAKADGITVSTSGNPGMASGGMGDVLTGVIAALSGQGLSLDEAAEQGCLIHGMAADYAAELHGERGLLASDLMPFLRKLVN